MSCTPPYSYVDYTIANGAVNAVLSYGSIDMFNNVTVPHSTQLTVVRYRPSTNVSTTLALTTDYTVNSVSEQVTILAASIETGDIIRISRDTDICDRFVDYTNNSILDESELDKDSNQLFFLIQELADADLNTIQLTNPLDPNSCWDGQGREACNFAPATAGTSLTTLTQVLALLNDVQVADVDSVLEWYFTGDGVTTEFTLTGSTTGLDAAQLFVTVANVIQDPNTSGGAYTTSDTATATKITFTSAPPNGAPITVRLLTGTFQAFYDDGTINGSALVNGTVTADKLNMGAGVADRVLTVGTTGAVTVEPLTADVVTDLATTVKAYRLDEFAVPTATINFNSQRLSNLSTGVNSADAVNKGQMDAAIAAGVGGFNPTTVTSVAIPTTYKQNTSSKAIMVIGRKGSANLWQLFLSANGSTDSPGIICESGSAQANDMLMTFVPAGWYYKFNASVASSFVYEFTQ